MICTCETTCLTGISFKRERERKNCDMSSSQALPCFYWVSKTLKTLSKADILSLYSSDTWSVAFSQDILRLWHLCTEVPVPVSGQPTPFWSLDGSWYQRKIEILKRMICSAWSPSGCCTSHFWPQICSSWYHLQSSKLFVEVTLRRRKNIGTMVWLLDGAITFVWH